MARVTRIKVDALNLPEIFAEGYVTRTGKVVTGDNWKYFKYTFGIVTENVVNFQLPVNSIPLDSGSPKIKMTVNGINIDISFLSVHENATNTIVYDSAHPEAFQIDSTDLVEFWIPETTTT